MRYQLSIPKPCQENWHKMTTAERGKFCDSCKKNVFDFTAHSPHQLFDELEANGKVCGRFRPEQLNRDLHVAPAKRGFTFQWLLSSTLLFAGFQKLKAQGQPNSYPLGKVELHQSDSADFALQATPIITDSIAISGKVTDKLTKEAVPFVNIFVAETLHGTPTDVDGRFELTVPKDSVMIRVEMIGYANQQILVIPNQKNTFLKIELLEDETLMGDICIVKPTIWQRMGNWFRRVF